MTRDHRTATDAARELNASDPLYLDLDDLAGAISAYKASGPWGRDIRPGQILGFARKVSEFMPEWSEETCHRFVVEAAS